jgi:hypothetical protein
MTIPDEILDLDLVKIGMYIYIKRKCGKAGECDVSMKELGERFGLTRPTTSRYLTELYDLKVLYTNGHQTDTKRTPEQELKDRKLAFGMQLKPFSGTYPRPMLAEFYDYWTEVKEGGRKMRFEKEKTFEIAKRLARWKRNDDERKLSRKASQDIGMVYHKEEDEFKNEETW